MPVEQKNVLMVIAPRDFRDEELFDTRKVLEQNKCRITVASTTLNEVRGMLGGKAKPDKLLKDVKVDDYDAVIFVGGMGSSVYFNDPTAHKLAKEASEKNKVLGAICIAPSILANAGLLKGKRATAFSSEGANLRRQGATYTAKSVEVDGKIVTSEGPASATEFARAIVKTLSG